MAASNRRKQAAENALAVAHVLRQLRTLSPDRAEVVSLRLFAGLEVSEISLALRKPETAVRMLLHRGLRDLQTRMPTAFPGECIMTWQPREDEQKAAEELDRLIGALQRGQHSPAPPEDTQLVQQLLQYAADVQPDQTFTSNSLRARLVAQANQQIT